MKARISPNHPLYVLFADLVREQVATHISKQPEADVEAYLTELLVSFLHTDEIFRLRDAEGRPLNSIFEMLAEGDVRLNADSFDREREVHKYVGDYILFWSGVYPEYLRRLKLGSGAELVCDYTQVGQQSYLLVSSYRHDPYGHEAPVFEKLSHGFSDFSFILAQVGHRANIHFA